MVSRIKHLGLVFVIAWLSVLGLLVKPVLAASATLSLSPASTTVSVGSVISIGIYENSGSEPVNASSVSLTYPTAKFDFVSIGSSAAFNVIASNSGGSGSVHVDRGALTPVTGSQLVAIVNLKAKVSSGTATVSIDSDSSVISSDSHENILAASSGGSYTFQEAPVGPVKDTTPPSISGVTVSAVTTSSAVVSWKTSEPATSEVDYGLDKSYGLTAVDATLSTDHKITLDSVLIQPGVQYHFVVKSADTSGNVATDSDTTFNVKGATLLITVIDQKDKPIKSAKVNLAGQSGVTDKNGQISLQGFGLGKQNGTVTYKNQATSVSYDIKTVSPLGKPQNVTFKIRTPKPSVWVYIIPIIGLLILLLFVAESLFVKRLGLWPVIVQRVKQLKNPKVILGANSQNSSEGLPIGTPNQTVFKPNQSDQDKNN